MVDATYHRVWRAKRIKEDPTWLERRNLAYRAYIQRKKTEDPEWYEKRKVSKKESYLRHRVLKPRHKMSPEEKTRRRMEYYQRVKRIVLNAYGGICDCCGERDFKVLSIDHIGNGRPEGRKRHGNNLYVILRRSNFPKGYRVLCLNCNMALGFYGYCPHKGVPNGSLTRMQKALRKLKTAVINGYGGRCVHCGESIIEFLEIDHVNGGGRQHLESLTRRFYNVLKEQNYPSGYQVLCTDCNWRKYLNGKVNHGTEKTTTTSPIRLPEDRSSVISS